MIEVMFQVRKDGFKDNKAVDEGLDVVEEEDQFTHLITIDEATDPQDLLSKINLIVFSPLILIYYFYLQTCLNLTLTTSPVRKSTLNCAKSCSMSLQTMAAQEMEVGLAVKNRTMKVLNCKWDVVERL